MWKSFVLELRGEWSELAMMHSLDGNIDVKNARSGRARSFRSLTEGRSER
jgi:hypothetical protein